MTITKLKIAIADYYPLSAKSLSALLSGFTEFEMAGDVRSCAELYYFLEREPADIVLIEISGANLSDGCNFRKIIAKFPDTKLIALYSDTEDRVLQLLKDYGIQHFLSKELQPNAFARQLCELADITLSSSAATISKKTSENYLRDHFNLSCREIEVMSLMEQGLTSADIAEKLYISLNTVKQHRKHILQKLNLKNVQEVVAFSIKNSRSLNSDSLA